MLFVVIFAVRFGTTGVVIAIAGTILMVAVVIGRQLSPAARSYLAIDADGVVRFKGALRKRTLFAISPPGKAVRCWLQESGAARAELWVLLNGNGNAELALSTRAWRDEDLAKVCERLRISEERSAVARDIRQLIAQYPGILPKWTVHIRAIAVVGTLLFVVVLSGILAAA